MALASNRAGTTKEDIYFSRRADRSAAWSLPEIVPGINSDDDDWDAFIGDRGRQIFFNSYRGGMAGDLYWALRASTNDPFGAVQPLTEINSPANDTDPALSRDLRYIMFGSNRGGSPDIYEAWR